ncbi:MAG: glycosyltransferase [Candidatus Omnitrophota bacterium]|nr:glycosyltransferase [Candidatus Omnitrophota bacterium]
MMNILVIHATAGAGHKKAAEAIFNELQRTPHHVRIADALDYTHPFFKKSYVFAYVFLVTKLPWLWQFFFGLLDIPALWPLVRWVRRVYNGTNAGALEKFLTTEQFDVIICTHFLAAEVLAYLKRAGRIRARVICAVTDFDVHRIWVNEGIDVYAVACDYTRDKMLALGVPATKISVTGIPIDGKFSESYDIGALQRKLGLREGLLTILIATGSFGMGPIAALIGLLKDHQLIVVCGHNKILFEDLKGRAGKDTHVMGLVDNMPELMAVADVLVTKPGGLSIAEALARKLPMIFFSAIPGQETGNIRVLKTYGVGRGQCAPQEIVRIIDDWSSSPRILRRLKDDLAILSKPNAAADIVRLIT